MPTIQVDIVSAEGEIHSGDASMVFAPASMGEVGIAPRHAPMLTTLKPGEVRVQDADGNEEAFYITGGMLEVQPTRPYVATSWTKLRLSRRSRKPRKPWKVRRRRQMLLAPRRNLPRRARATAQPRSSRASDREIRLKQKKGRLHGGLFRLSGT